MKTNLLYGLKPVYKMIFVFILIFHCFSIVLSSGCSGIDYLQDEQNIKLLQNVFSEATFYTYDAVSEIYTVYNNSKKQIGYAFYAEGMGEYIDGKQMGTKIPGPIIIMVGLKDKETLKSIFVISHSETPGAWEYLIKRNYFNQFEDIKLEDAYFIQAGGKVDSVSGATISSKLVLNTVRETILRKIKFI